MLLTNWDDANAMLREMALIEVRLTDADAVRATAILAAETDYKRVTTPLIATKQSYSADLASFYKTRRKEVEKDGKRSIELQFGRMGMRKGNPTLKLQKKWKWADVLSAVKNTYGKKKELLAAFVTTKETLNKDAIKRQCSVDDLAQIGVKLDQPDEFYIDIFPEKAKEVAA